MTDNISRAAVERILLSKLTVYETLIGRVGITDSLLGKRDAVINLLAEVADIPPAPEGEGLREALGNLLEAADVYESSDSGISVACDAARAALSPQSPTGEEEA